MRIPAFTGVTIRAVSLVGFGLTLAVWSFAGYRFAQRVAEVQNEATKVDERFLRAQELLSTVRTQVLLGSVYMRDSLIDADPLVADDHRRRAEETFRAVDTALQQYVPILDSPAELERIDRLRREIGTFRGTMLGITASVVSHSTGARPPVEDWIAPGEIVLDVSDQVQRLNRAAYLEQQASVADIFALTERQMWRQFGLVLALSVGIGLVAFWHVGRLEAHLQRQHSKDIELTRNLQQLSGRLIHAQEEERRNIARELHDQLGQELTALRLTLNALKARSSERPDLHQHMERLDTIAQQLDRDVDFLVWELRPTALDDFGLRAALERHIQTWSTMNGITAELHATGFDGARLTPEIETTLFRIAQEALNNTARHARASRADVILERRSNQVSLIVEDDGVGFDPSDESAFGQQMGLAGMRERAALVGASIHIESAPHKGTTIFVRAHLLTAGEESA